MSAARPRILHVHAAFDAEGGALRCARLINALGEADHALVSGDPARRSAAALIDKRRKVSWPKFPSLEGKPWPGRLKRLAEAMAGYDLICTYGGGALDAALAHTLFADVYKLAPLVHHENEPGGRSFYRRIALGRTAALVVPSRALERVAIEQWQQPRTRVRRIADGIDTRAYSKQPKRDALPGLVKYKDEFWVGALAEADADPATLMDAVARLDPEWHLVIVGDVRERSKFLGQAETLGIEDRVHLPGAGAASAEVVGLFDIFAHLPGSFDGGVVEAMAAGKPVVASRAGEVAELVASDNGPYLHAAGDGARRADALQALAADPALRKRIGEANRARARAEFDQAVMIERYRALYWSLMGRK